MTAPTPPTPPRSVPVEMVAAETRSAMGTVAACATVLGAGVVGTGVVGADVVGGWRLGAGIDGTPPDGTDRGAFTGDDDEGTGLISGQRWPLVGSPATA